MISSTPAVLNDTREEIREQRRVSVFCYIRVWQKGCTVTQGKKERGCRNEGWRRYQGNHEFWRIFCLSGNFRNTVMSPCVVSSILLVCTWRHGGHVGGQEQKHFSPLGTKLYFHVNSSRKNSIVLTPNMAALSRGCKPRILEKSLRFLTRVLLEAL